MGFSPKRELINDKAPRFQPCQIVCLEHEASCLYAEVIQIIEGRQICWVRPLMLTVSASDAAIADVNPQETLNCYDLRDDSDLLWPLSLFRAALDVEVLPLMTNLYALEHTGFSSNEAPGEQHVGHQQFRQFVQQVWQAHSDIF